MAATKPRQASIQHFTDQRVLTSQKYRRLAKNFADNLREIRGEKTVRAFAKEIAMYPAEWNKFETGRKMPSFTKLLELCDKLGKTPDELIYGNHRRK